MIAGLAPVRRRSVAVRVGDVVIGGDAPIVVQSMTNTDTADVAAPQQVRRWPRPARNWCASRSTRARRPRRCRDPRAPRRRWAADVPLVGDFHYNGHAADRVSGLRRGAGQVSHQSRQRRLRHEAGQAVRHHDRGRLATTTSPVRIGVNWGSLDQALLTRMMDENARSPAPRTPREVMREALVTVGPGQRRAGRGDWDWRATASCCRARSATCRI